MDWGCLPFCIVFSISTSAGSAACLQRVPVLKQCSEMSLLLPPFVLPGKKKKKKSGPRRQSSSAPALRKYAICQRETTPSINAAAVIYN